jgi:hypothetical protein
VCSLVGSAAEASPIAQLRAAAEGSRQQVSQLKVAQSELRGQLDEVAARIDLLKEQQRDLFPGNELKSWLRRSQDLSRELTAVAHSLSEEEAKAQKNERALISGLSEELRRLGAEWDGAQGKEARQRLITQMRSLRAERERSRSLLPVAAVSVPESSPASDDPEGLLEQADALRDSEDKLREQLRALEIRIAEVREERELDLRMRDFLGDQAMFDEQDRRFRMRRGPESEAAFGSTDFRGPAGASSGRTEASQPPPAAAQGGRAAEKPPQPEEGRRQIAIGSAADSLPSLEARRRQLQSLADEIQRKAREVESRAREPR